MSWFFTQLTSYGFFTLVALVVLAYVFARKGGWPGVFVGHCAIALLILVVDGIWISQEMNKPGWDGVPDLDFIFFIGSSLRIVLINVLLLPVSLS